MSWLIKDYKNRDILDIEKISTGEVRVSVKSNIHGFDDTEVTVLIDEEDFDILYRKIKKIKDSYDS